MLDKLNAIANAISELLATHPDAKKKKAAEGSPEEEASESPSAEAAEDAPAKAEKSMRKNMGGMKEPK